MALLSSYLASLDNVLTITQCNEVHPICGNCHRHNVPCVYDHLRARTPTGYQEPNNVSDVTAGPNISLESGTAITNSEHLESEGRRLLELKLLSQWMMKTALSFPGTHEKSYREAMTHGAPELALQHRALLYSMFSFSALHIAKTSPFPNQRLEFMDVHRRYLGLALQEHRVDIENLGKAKADTVCMTSSLIRNCTQAVLQDRPLHPYTPPTQWLQMMNGSGDVFKTAWDWIGDDDSSIARRVAQHGPDLSDLSTLFGESNLQVFIHLLRRSPVDEEQEPWNPEIQKSYELTLSYIGGVQMALNKGETPGNLCRRLVAFPMFIPKRFIGLVEELRPRALVVLAHYFAFLARLRDTWWIGDSGRREICAVRSVLKNEWVELLNWPLLAMEETSVMVPWEYN
jgi:hypothetical protein